MRNKKSLDEICTLDVILKPDEYKLLKGKYVIGVYVLFIKKEPMYVGRSEHLDKRLYSHLNKNSANTKGIINEVDEIGIRFVNGRFNFEYEFLESAFIMHYNPPLNEKRNKWRIARSLEYKYKKQCKNIYNNGTECKREAHGNGYCSWHGGNGITAKHLANEEVEEYIKNNIQLKLII